MRSRGDNVAVEFLEANKARHPCAINVLVRAHVVAMTNLAWVSGMVCLLIVRTAKQQLRRSFPVASLPKMTLPSRGIARKIHC